MRRHTSSLLSFATWTCSLFYHSRTHTHQFHSCTVAPIFAATSSRAASFSLSLRATQSYYTTTCVSLRHASSTATGTSDGGSGDGGGGLKGGGDVGIEALLSNIGKDAGLSRSLEDALLHRLDSFIPPTFTAVSQIVRHTPKVLLVEACGVLATETDEQAALLDFLVRFPDRYAVSTVGCVQVVRRLSPTSTWSHSQRRKGQRQQQQQQRQLKGGVAASAPLTATAVVLNQQHQHTGPIVTHLPREAALLFPTFVVPVRSLWQTEVTASSPSLDYVSGGGRSSGNISSGKLNEKEEVLRALVAYAPYLLHINPYIGLLATSVNDHVFEEAIRSESGRELLEKGFVSVHPRYHYMASKVLEGERVRGSFDLLSLPNERLASHHVQNHEWYRVARLLPGVNEEVRVSPDLLAAAKPLLPLHRSLLHVFASAPQLFLLRADLPLPPSSPSSLLLPQHSGSTQEVRGRVVWVRFLLDCRFIPSCVRDPDVILADLDALHKRAVNAHKVRFPIDRAKKRALTCELQFAQRPLPYHDERVLAQHLFDLLPLEDCVRITQLVPALPPEAAACLATSAKTVLKQYPHLFSVVSIGGRDDFVQRADLPPPRTREAASVDAEEVLLEVLRCYPRRRSPRAGVCLCLLLPLLPRLVVARLYEFNDVIDEVLRRYPEKVELVPPDSEEGKAMAEMATPERLRGCRGRTDFFVPFRFVGVWREGLEKKYAALCRKHRYDPETTLFISNDSKQ